MFFQISISGSFRYIPIGGISGVYYAKWNKSDYIFTYMWDLKNANRIDTKNRLELFFEGEAWGIAKKGEEF